MAIGLRTKRKARIKNVLQRQKVLTHNSSPYLKIAGYFSIKILISLAVLVPPILIFRSIHTFLNEHTKISVNEFHLNFEGNFPDSVKEKLYKDIGVLIGRQNPSIPTIENLSRDIQEKQGLSRVHAFIDVDNNLSITLSPRTPIMAIMTDKERVISTEGDIYEDNNFAPANRTVLTGVFSEDHLIFSLDERNCVIISDKEKKTILDAIQLINTAKLNSIFFSTIEFKKYRGFFAIMKDSPTTVVFGTPPFDKQFSRLSKILEEAKKKNTTLKNIEIDYNDKAFITEIRI